MVAYVLPHMVWFISGSNGNCADYRRAAMSKAWVCIAVGCCCGVALTFKAWTVGTDLSAALKDVGGAATGIGLAAKTVAISADQLPGKVLPSVTQEIDDLGRLIVARTDAQVTALRGDLISRVDKIEADSAILGASAISSLNQQFGQANASISTLVGAASPALTNSAVLVKNINDSIDDNYDDGRALLQSLTVATTQTAQTMEYVRGASPAYLAMGQQVLAQVQLTNIQFTGIVTAGNKIATKFTTPLTTKQKIFEGFKLGGIMAARFF